MDPLSVVFWAGRVDVTGTRRPRQRRQRQMALTVKSSHFSHLLNFQKKNTENWRERVLKYIVLFRLPPTAESAWTPSSSPFHTILVKRLHFRPTTFYFCSVFTWKGGSLLMLLTDRRSRLRASSVGGDPKYQEIGQSFSSSQTQLFWLTHFQNFWQEHKRTGWSLFASNCIDRGQTSVLPFTAWVWDTTQSWRPRATWSTIWTAWKVCQEKSGETSPWCATWTQRTKIFFRHVGVGSQLQYCRLVYVYPLLFWVCV